MATLAEIRARLKSQEVNRSTSSVGGDNAIYPHWNIQENQEAVVRFLPDKDPNNTFFWTERAMIKLPFAGIKGQADSRPVQVQVPCMEMYGETCPVLTEVRPWFKDKSMEDMGRKYWKKKSYIFQGFVLQNPLADDKTPENPIRRFIIGPQIFNIIRAALLDPEMEELPTDYVRGVDFRITKTSKGGYADYSTSKWSRRERALDETERAAIDKFGLFNLSDFRPKKPSEAEVKIIKELFEKSVEGEAYDVEKYGQYFRPAGVSIAAIAANGSANGSASVIAPIDGEEIVTKVEAVKAAPAAAAPQPSTDSAKRAEDILKLIRSRQSK
jgi:gp32 DNA binding protein like